MGFDPESDGPDTKVVSVCRRRYTADNMAYCNLFLLAVAHDLGLCLPFSDADAIVDYIETNWCDAGDGLSASVLVAPTLLLQGFDPGIMRHPRITGTLLSLLMGNCITGSIPGCGVVEVCTAGAKETRVSGKSGRPPIAIRSSTVMPPSV